GPVFEGVVLGANRQVPLPALARQPFRDGPGHQHRRVAVEHLEADVVVEAGGVMLLDHGSGAGGGGQGVDVRFRPRPFRLGSLVEATLLFVLGHRLHLGPRSSPTGSQPALTPTTPNRFRVRIARYGAQFCRENGLCDLRVWGLTQYTPRGYIRPMSNPGYLTDKDRLLARMNRIE